MDFFKHRKVSTISLCLCCCHLDLTNASTSPYPKPSMVTVSALHILFSSLIFILLSILIHIYHIFYSNCCLMFPCMKKPFVPVPFFVGGHLAYLSIFDYCKLCCKEHPGNCIPFSCFVSFSGGCRGGWAAGRLGSLCNDPAPRCSSWP